MVQTSPDYITDNELAQDNNQRESYRMPPTPGAERATVKIGSDEFKCEIIDQSAGGYQISAAALPRMPSGQPVQLTCETGRHSLQVVWQRIVDDTVRIGLQRLSDATDEGATTRSNTTWIVGVILVIYLCIAAGFLF